MIISRALQRYTTTLVSEHLCKINKKREIQATEGASGMWGEGEISLTTGLTQKRRAKKVNRDHWTAGPMSRKCRVSLATLSDNADPRILYLH